MESFSMNKDNDKVVYMRVPQPILDVVDTTVSEGMYSNRAEVLRELLRNGMKMFVTGYCIDLKKFVDCCNDDECEYFDDCSIVRHKNGGKKKKKGT